MNKFALIGHPIDLKHLYSLLGVWGRLAKKLPRDFLYNLLLMAPPYKYCNIKDVRSLAGAKASGCGIIAPFLPQQIAFLEEEIVIKKIVRAVKLAEKMGSRIAVLGGFTSIVGNEGEIVSKRVNIPVTSGNTYTACLAIEGIEKAATLMDLNLKEAKLAIIGATGDIGSICTKVFSKKVNKINIAARNEKKLSEFASFIRNYGTCQVELFKYSKDAVRDADIILTVTSAVSVLIEPGDLKPGSIVCDVALPANVAKEVVSARDDILVFEGGLARPPFLDDIKTDELQRAAPPFSIFGCLAEGILLTLDGRFENYSMGRGNITEERIDEMTFIAKRHGFTTSDFFCGYKTYSLSDISDIKKKAESKKKRWRYAER